MTIRGSLQERIRTLLTLRNEEYIVFNENLSKSESLSDVSLCLKLLFPEMFETRFFKMSYRYHEVWASLEYKNGAISYKQDSTPEFYPYEKQFYDFGATKHKVLSFDKELGDQVKVDAIADGGVYVWLNKNVEFKESVVTLAVDSLKDFSVRALNDFMHYVASIERRMRNILFLERLRNRRNEVNTLNDACNEAEDQVLEIDAIMKYQDEVVRNQIKEINNRGLHIYDDAYRDTSSYSHLLGLSKLISKLSTFELMHTVLPILKTALEENEEDENLKNLQNEIDNQLLIRAKERN